MNGNVIKVFDILGIKPYEKFKIEGNGDTIYYIDEKLYVYRDDEILRNDKGLNNLINGSFKIIKLLNTKKKKLRDITKEEWDKWLNKNCGFATDCSKCDKCIFNNVMCYTENCIWLNHKDLYSDKFLDQEIEVE